MGAAKEPEQMRHDCLNALGCGVLVALCPHGLACHAVPRAVKGQLQACAPRTAQAPVPGRVPGAQASRQGARGHLVCRTPSAASQFEGRRCASCLKAGGPALAAWGDRQCPARLHHGHPPGCGEAACQRPGPQHSISIPARYQHTLHWPLCMAIRSTPALRVLLYRSKLLLAPREHV